MSARAIQSIMYLLKVGCYKNDIYNSLDGTK